MANPVIGLTAEHFSSGYFPEPDRGVQGVLGTYIDALLGAGGLPVLIPVSVTDADLRGLLERLDGLLIPGGGDVDPAYYGQTPHPELGEVDPDRDRVELAAARLALASGQPLLGVCRGAQVMNIAQGGTLVQDLPSQFPQALRHAHPVKDFSREHLAHPVQIEEESLLARSLGKPIVQVNSRHHQAIQRVAPGLVVVARAPDGVIEGIEQPGHPFALGVQWHPENLQALPEMKALFVKFVEACARNKV